MVTRHQQLGAFKV